MDEQTPTKIPWLTLDILLIVGGLILVGVGAWLGF
jgi:hypothetical protein